MNLFDSPRPKTFAKFPRVLSIFNKAQNMPLEKVSKGAHDKKRISSKNL